MLTEEQQAATVTITGAEAVVALQIVSRLLTVGGLKDVELAPVGTARDGISKALETATGVNFDQTKAQLEAEGRQRVAAARAQQEAAAVAASDDAGTVEVVAEAVDVAADEAPKSTPKKKRASRRSASAA
jgi:hypothetical protein